LARYVELSEDALAGESEVVATAAMAAKPRTSERNILGILSYSLIQVIARRSVGLVVNLPANGIFVLVQRALLGLGDVTAVE
jgi:hypothetical protein